MRFEPLGLPIPWPPPSLTEQSRWYSVPLLGWFARQCRSNKIGEQLARFIQREVTSQLESRQTYHCDWPSDALQRRVVEALSETVCSLKCLRHNQVALHPDDPIILLLYGNRLDDITPASFCEALHNRFGVEISRRDLFSFVADASEGGAGSDIAWFSSRRTVRELVDFCVRRIHK
jgi:hypothetical protein